MKKTNILEQLSNQNLENYHRYLTRMTESASKSSKNMIPLFCAGYHRILDVGCGSGITLEQLRVVHPDADLTGIDLNQNAIDYCQKKYEKQNITFLHKGLQEVEQDVVEGRVKPFDCVILCSVLHEISSYDENYPYCLEPITATIKTVHNILSDNGIMIIRDGINGRVSPEVVDVVNFSFKNEEDIKWLKRFCQEYHRNPFYHLYKKTKEIKMFWDDAKEFFMTYTWGEESWNREIQEQLGILTEQEWIKVVEDVGFFIRTLMFNAEEYYEYLSEKLNLNDNIKKLMKKNMIIMVAQKES